jgi:hypothetical protein
MTELHIELAEVEHEVTTLCEERKENKHVMVYSTAAQLAIILGNETARQSSLPVVTGSRLSR